MELLPKAEIEKLMIMERPIRLLSPLLLLLLLLVSASEMGPAVVVEARTCESQSHRFKGTCLSSTNCASVCQTEGFPSGDCRGVRRRCFCSKPC